MSEKKYDYANVEQISGLEYKYSMTAAAALIAIHLGFLGIGGGTTWIVLTTALSLYVWWSFRQYFVKVEDKATAKWLLVIIFTITLFGLSNLIFYSTTSMFEELPTNTFVYGLFNFLFYFVMASLIAFIAVCIKIISVNRNHSFPLKRIAISAALFIPLYMLVTSFSNIQFIWQAKEVMDVVMADPTGGMLTAPDMFSGLFSSVKFLWNLLIMIPYFFLFFHFYKADQAN